MLQASRSALEAYIKKNLPLLSPGVEPLNVKIEVDRVYGSIKKGESLNPPEPPGDREAKLKMYLKSVEVAAEALPTAFSDTSSISPDEFYSQTEDVLLPYLDNLQGSSIDSTDYSIFNALSRKYESRFFEDMRNLNVLDPDVLTRVTEYIPQIIAFTERLVKNGFGYEVHEGSNKSSVYFDIAAFEKAGWPYARLEPWNRNNKELQADGEGALIAKTTEKKSSGDFALWKASKPGEPSWDSPWGGGRPGWHIECSAMASDVLGKQLDIHSGGIDLCFPHHDNELAQSEAYWATHGQQWVNYFIHMGHLSIAGSKMSKSLKNFTTIREALDKKLWTARGLRIVFLLSSWKDGVEITEDLVKMSKAWEEKVNTFFLNGGDLARRSGGKSASKGSPLLLELQQTKDQIDTALRNSFDTPTVMAAISTLITTANKGIPSDLAMIDLAKYITELVHIFGLDSEPIPMDGIGWSGSDIPVAAKEPVFAASALRDAVRKQAIASSGLQQSDIDGLLSAHVTAKGNAATMSSTAESKPYVEALEQFKRDLKGLATQNAAKNDYLALCDQLRDTSLWDIGIFLEDRENAPALVRPVDDELRSARAEKEARMQQKAAAKEAARLEKERKEREEDEKAKVDPKQMFRMPEYSAWDDEGLPIKEADGSEVTKSKSKKLRKEWERQKKAHEGWLKKQQNGKKS